MSILKAFQKPQGKRELVIDTEATGLHIKDGHRLVEVAMVEMIGGKLTGKELHVYINPEMHIPEEVVAIHHIDDAFAKDKPTFKEVAQQIRDFVGDDTVVITCRTEADGYTLDINMMNNEMKKAGVPEIPYEQWLNVRRWSEEMFGDKGARLDNVLDHYGISRKERDENGHGGMLDTRLLAQAYPKLKEDWAAYQKKHPAAAANAEARNNLPKPKP